MILSRSICLKDWRERFDHGQSFLKIEKIERSKIERLKIERLKIERSKIERSKIERWKIERSKIERWKIERLANWKNYLQCQSASVWTLQLSWSEPAIAESFFGLILILQQKCTFICNYSCQNQWWYDLITIFSEREIERERERERGGGNIRVNRITLIIG